MGIFRNLKHLNHEPVLSHYLRDSPRKSVLQSMRAGYASDFVFKNILLVPPTFPKSPKSLTVLFFSALAFLAWSSIPSTHAFLLGETSFLLFGPAIPKGASSSIHENDEERAERPEASPEPGIASYERICTSGVTGARDSAADALERRTFLMLIEELGPIIGDSGLLIGVVRPLARPAKVAREELTCPGTRPLISNLPSEIDLLPSEIDLLPSEVDLRP